MITFEKCSSLQGNIKVPADKSMTHRAIILASMADGVSVINNPLISRDTEATINIMQELGVNIANERSRLLISSEGYHKFKEPYGVLNCDNSGTTARLCLGVLAPMKFFSSVAGDPSLHRRPMDRIINPLRKMGANIFGKKENTLLPACVVPANMHGATIEAEHKSAQVKSGVLLAAAQIEGETTYTEKTLTRDHTEKMMPLFGVDIESKDGVTKIKGGKPLNQAQLTIPADFSSAAFYIGAGMIFDNSDIVIENCGLNPTRTGLLTALEHLGVKIETEITDTTYEQVGTIRVKPAKIKGGRIDGDLVANMIDEVPILAMLGLFGESPLEIRDAKELRVKESDRIAALVNNFKALGANIEEFEDGLKIYPLEKEPEKATLLAFDDHRISMVNIILAKKFGIKVLLDNVIAIEVSYPHFIGDLLTLEVKEK